MQPSYKFDVGSHVVAVDGPQIRNKGTTIRRHFYPYGTSAGEERASYEVRWISGHVTLAWESQLALDCSATAGAVVEAAIEESRAQKRVAVLQCHGVSTLYRAACALLAPVAEYRERCGTGRVYGIDGDFVVEVQL